MILDLSSICHEGFKIKFTDPEIGILLSYGTLSATPAPRRAREASAITAAKLVSLVLF